MKVLIDGQKPVEVENSVAAVKDAMATLITVLQDLNRIPIQVIQDGVEFASLEQWLNQEDLTTAQEVNIVTADIKEFQYATVVECYKYLNNILEGIEEICSNFQIGNEGEAIEQFIKFSEGLNWITDVIRLCEPIFTENAISFETQQLNSLLKDLITAWENKDFVLVSDLMEYEIKPILEEWQTKMGEMVNV